MGKINVLLTGATGFVGSFVLEKLLENKKFNVIILKRSYSNLWRIDKYLKYVKQYDVDKIDLEEVFKQEKIDVIVHLATFYNKKDSLNDIENLIDSNLTFSLKLLYLASKYGVNRFLYTTTCFEKAFNGEIAFNNYAASKKAFEEFLKLYNYKYGLQVIIMRLFSPYGPKDKENKLIPTLIKNYFKDRISKLSAGFQRLDFTYVEDIADVIVEITDKKLDTTYLKFDLATGRSYSIRELVTILGEILEDNLRVIWGREKVGDENINYYSDTSKLRQLFPNKKFKNLHEGLNKTVEYYENRGD